MTDLGGLFLLWLLGGAKGSGSTSSTPVSFPTGTPVSVPPPIVPVAYQGAAPSKWEPYKPLTPAVIDRAQRLLRDPTFTTELVEPDPVHGQVRYLRVHPSPGHTSVTAWMPKAPSGVAV